MTKTETNPWNGNTPSIVRAIANDKYPSPPARDLYFVCKGKPKKELVAAFMKWVGNMASNSLAKPEHGPFQGQSSTGAVRIRTAMTVPQEEPDQKQNNSRYC